MATLAFILGLKENKLSPLYFKIRFPPRLKPTKYTES